MQAGIPRLPDNQIRGWTRGPLSQHLYAEARPVSMDDGTDYKLVTVKRARGGVIQREILKGYQISVKSQFRIYAGDFLISKRQIVHGACGLVPAELDGSIVSNEYSVLRSKPSLDLDFFNYLSHSRYFQQTCFHSSIGVHVEKMIFKLDKWLNWPFDLPPVEEQRKIAEILSTWDRAIETVEKLIANAKEQKKALMQQLLTGKKRLPGFSGEWEEKKLGDLGVFRKGKGIPRSILVENGIPCVRYGEIYTHHDYIVREFHSFIPREHISETELIKKGDVLFTCSGETSEEIGKCVVYQDNLEAYAGGDIIIFSGHQQHPSYLGYILNSIPVAQQKARFGQGNSVVHISTSSLERLEFLLPDFKEQHAIAKVIEDSDFLIRSKLILLQKLKLEKSALMQQLLTGKRRVKIEKERAA